MFNRRHIVIQNYQDRLDELKEAGRASGLSDEEIEVTLKESVLYLEERHGGEIETEQFPFRRRSSWRRYLLTLIVMIIMGSCCFFSFYRPVHNFVERNIQEIIYPFMTSYRRMTLPIVETFPLLTELYDESCLLENPYFQVSDMDCWPCENARVVLNLTESVAKAHVGLPFIAKTGEMSVTLADLRDVYLTHKSLIDENAGRLTSNMEWRKVANVLGSNEDLALTHPEAQVTWRINRMEAGRLLRRLLKPPKEPDLPPHASSPGIERFILIDGPSAPPYPLPAAEGANIFLKQLSGQRLIVLEPAPECRGSCRRLSVLLEEQHILWYNWWYWRPRSIPIQNASLVSVSFLGSTA